MRRELNEIEYFNWCVGQPYNMVVVVQIRGELQPEKLREALSKAQQRHPLLRVNTEIGPNGIPWFSAEGVGAIPLTVVEQAKPEDAQTLADSELEASFARDEPGSQRLPLLRVSLLFPLDSARPIDVVFTAQHVIADGLSMVFLVRDLLHFLEQPDAPVVVVDAPASSEDLLPARVRRRVATSPFRLQVVLWLASLYVRLRFGRRAVAPRQHSTSHRAWQLTVEQTTALRARCRREGVSVHSAICTAFLPEFPAIHTPVSLRGLLARPVGESFGLFIGAAEVEMKYRATRGFWSNARGFQRRLYKRLRNPFGIFALVSKAVPVAMVRQFGSLMVKVMSNARPFAVTNLGQLDGSGVQLQGRDLKIESFFGAVTGILDSSVLTVYTIGGTMHLHLLANDLGQPDADRGVKRLLEGSREQFQRHRACASLRTDRSSAP
jgi:hypothetical protein